MIAEVMCFTPRTPAIESSTHFVTWVWSSDGAAPACVIATETMGTSIFGMRVTGSPRKLTRPRTIRTRNRTSGPIGLRIAQAETLRRIGTNRVREMETTEPGCSGRCFREGRLQRFRAGTGRSRRREPA